MNKQIDFEFITKRGFEEMYTAYYSRLLNYAKSIVSIEEEAENVIQDVFTMLWGRRNHLKINTNITNYLMTLVKYYCIDHLRRQKCSENIKEKIQENFDQELMGTSKNSKFFFTLFFQLNFLVLPNSLLSCYLFFTSTLVSVINLYIIQLPLSVFHERA